MTTGIKAMLEAANAAVPRITPRANKMMVRDCALVVGVSNAREREKDGKVAAAVHVSRGELEFRFDRHGAGIRLILGFGLIIASIQQGVVAASVETAKVVDWVLPIVPACTAPVPHRITADPDLALGYVEFDRAPVERDSSDVPSNTARARPLWSG